MVRRKRTTLKATLRASLLAIVGSALFLLVACGGPGESAPVSCGLCGKRADVFGSISSKTGSQQAMSGWAIASIERDTGIARVAEISQAGLFTLRQVHSERVQTLALFTPDYFLHSVLSIDGTTPNTIRQFFTMNSPYLPQLISNGPIIRFQSLDGLTVTRDVAADSDGDGIPDGAAHIQGLGLLQGPGVPDTDRDGVPNDLDPDIDGDGIINVLDPDDDNDGIRDVFDEDANGNYVIDTAAGQTNTDLYFKEGVEYIGVKYEVIPKIDGTSEATLKFLTKVRDDVSPNAVQIRGAPSLLGGATFKVEDPTTGQLIDQTWNRLLGDDGHSDDGGPGDRIFAKTIKLAAGKAPRAYEAIFFQLAFGSNDNPWFLEFPYMFPDVSLGTLSAQYDANLRAVLLVGNPFGEVRDFVWTIYVYNAEGKNIWHSQPVPGTTLEFTMPAQNFEPGQNYTYKVVAQSLDKLPGLPSYVIHSLEQALR